MTSLPSTLPIGQGSGPSGLKAREVMALRSNDDMGGQFHITYYSTL